MLGIYNYFTYIRDMKNWNVRFVLHNSPASITIMISAKTYADAKKIIEGQYGSNLRSISSITESK